MAEPAYAFPGPPPKEALDYFRRKKLRVGFDWRDVWREEHDLAFTVAKAMDLSLLGSIREALDKALAEGRTLRDFQKELRPRLETAGWWGVKIQTDPKTGEEREVQLGSPRRLRTVFNTNMRTARAAGQWERVQRTKTVRPNLIYELGPSKHHRPEHVKWAGTILPVDHPWWKTHYPPNGWGCLCRVRQIGNAETERRGGIKEPPVEGEVDWKNERTGETLKVPAGIDPGWDRNFGETRSIPGAEDPAAPPIRRRMNLPAATPVQQSAGYEQSKHFTGGEYASKDIRAGRPAYFFNPNIRTGPLARLVMLHGTDLGIDKEGRKRFHRFSLDFFPKVIGQKVLDGEDPIPITIAELKARKVGTTVHYHVIPRAPPIAT